jgi:tetrahydromethanopterin S-methyltransferase subunit E
MLYCYKYGSSLHARRAGTDGRGSGSGFRLWSFIEIVFCGKWAGKSTQGFDLGMVRWLRRWEKP